MAEEKSLPIEETPPEQVGDTARRARGGPGVRVLGLEKRAARGGWGQQKREGSVFCYSPGETSTPAVPPMATSERQMPLPVRKSFPSWPVSEECP